MTHERLSKDREREIRTRDGNFDRLRSMFINNGYLTAVGDDRRALIAELDATRQERDELKRHIEVELLPDDPGGTKANWIDRCYGAETRVDALTRQIATVREQVQRMIVTRHNAVKYNEKMGLFEHVAHGNGEITALNGVLSLLPPSPETTTQARTEETT
jgi:hypothetical protein